MHLNIIIVFWIQIERMDSDADVFKKLIKKIDSGLSEIQTRSINTIHNKITLAVFDFELLPAYP